MATRRLYYDDSFQDNFTAQVLSCVPLAEAEDSGFGGVDVYEIGSGSAKQGDDISQRPDILVQLN